MDGGQAEFQNVSVIEMNFSKRTHEFLIHFSQFFFFTQVSKPAHIQEQRLQDECRQLNFITQSAKL